MKHYMSYSSSSSSTASSMYSWDKTIPTEPIKQQQQHRSNDYVSSLHLIRKNPMKPCKKPIAPMPPTPPRVYKVDPIHFMGLVQQLTGSPDQPMSHRLKTVAPPPINVSDRNPSGSSSGVMCKDFLSEGKVEKISDGSIMTMDSLGLSMSPSSYNWFAFPTLSPGTLSAFEPSSTVL